MQENEKPRLEILADILKNHLGISSVVQNLRHINYQCGYFLGRHDKKFEVLKKISCSPKSNNIIDTGKMRLQFIGKNETAPKASSTFLPIMLHSCPDSFSTIEYFDVSCINICLFLLSFTIFIISICNTVSDIFLGILRM